MKSTFAVSLVLLFLANQYSVTLCSAASTVLTIAPASTVLPLVDLGEGNMCFEVALKIVNAPKLKEFHLNFSYNPSVVELIGGELDKKFLSSSGGGTGDEFDMLLTNPYSGTGVLGRYTFRMVGRGNTSISLFNPHLLDASGNPILVTAQDCSVRILKLGDYSYFVHIVESQLNDLQEDYIALDSQYLMKSQEYEDLLLQYDNLTDDYHKLDSSYNQLESMYQGIYESHNELQRTNTTLEKELQDTRNILLVAVAGIVVMIIIFYQTKYRK
jgi:hypothetical protein